MAVVPDNCFQGRQFSGATNSRALSLLLKAEITLTRLFDGPALKPDSRRLKYDLCSGILEHR